MKNLGLIPERSSNPVLGDKTFDGLDTSGAAMTLDGTVNRSVFRKQWAPITAPLYAFAEGLFIGGISVLLEAT